MSRGPPVAALVDCGLWVMCQPVGPTVFYHCTGAGTGAGTTEGYRMCRYSQTIGIPTIVNRRGDIVRKSRTKRAWTGSSVVLYMLQ